MKNFQYYKNLTKDILIYLKDKIILRKAAAILTYHSISDNKAFSTVRPENFDWRMDYLKKNNYNVISLSALVELIRNKKKIPRKTIILTFDDGYADNFTEAFPTLKKHNFPATIFLATGLLNDRPYINKRGIENKMLTWSQIEEMHLSGLIDFEPHTVHHLKLTTLDQETADREISISKREIEEKLKKKCNYFAYPYGRHDEGTIALAKKYFLAALTTKEGLVSLNDSLFSLPRRSADIFINKLRFKLRI